MRSANLLRMGQRARRLPVRTVRKVVARKAEKVSRFSSSLGSRIPVPSLGPGGSRSAADAAPRCDATGCVLPGGVVMRGWGPTVRLAVRAIAARAAAVSAPPSAPTDETAPSAR